MINDYFRPKTITEAEELLKRFGDMAIILGGGTYISSHQPDKGIAIDLQDIKELRLIQTNDSQIAIGSMVTLQRLMDEESLDQQLGKAIAYEAGMNIRQSASIGGTLFTADGLSPLVVCLLALDAKIEFYSRENLLRLDDWFVQRTRMNPGVIITRLLLESAPRLKFDYSARTPRDRPLVFVAVAVWPTGRTRVALGGFGEAPLLVFDDVDASAAADAARTAYSNAQDSRASAAYRSVVAGKLVARLIDSII